MDNVGKSLSPITTDESTELKTIVTYEPYGSAAVISPWNFPFGISITGIVPNLLVGNTVLFKGSEETILLSKMIGEIFNRHNLPQGVFNQVLGAGDVGEKLANSDIDFIWFTGSTKVGQKLYQIAAEKMINVLLEMGGSSPCIVFEDADIDSAVKTVYDNRFLNTGQVCDVIKRLIVHESVFDKFVAKLKDEVECKVMCDPGQSKADLGPLVAERQLDLLESQVNDSVAKGARIISGGKRPEGHKGAYYEPTILTDVTKDMRVWDEEVFGPVVPVMKFKTEEEAVELANDTDYGLGARVISSDIERARRVAGKIEAGSVEINQGDRWASPNNPFGGYKKSGIGRENGAIGFQTLSQIKVISESK
jgi:acyl-CoA reductase-like NAD-dependent aldehyde dehydrogenase